MSKRIKISFQTVNKGKITAISSDRLAASNQRIKTVMTGVVRQYKRNEALSRLDARTLVLNA